MNIFLYTIPVAVLVAVSQLIVKWRSSKFTFQPNAEDFQSIWNYVSDLYIFTAYLFTLIASVLWLFAISKIPLSIGFPVYIGSAFIIVMLGSFFFLNEGFTYMKLLGIFFILLGIILGGLDQSGG